MTNGQKKSKHSGYRINSYGRNAFFIEGTGLPQTAKKFVDDAFEFFDKLSDSVLEYKPCQYEPWKAFAYRCVPYKKKYVVAYLSRENEIVICEFVSAKLIH